MQVDMASGVEPVSREERPGVVGIEGAVGGRVDVRIWVLDYGVLLSYRFGQTALARQQGLVDFLAGNPCKLGLPPGARSVKGGVKANVVLERGRRDHPGLGRIIPECFKVLDNDAAMVETAPGLVVELGVGRPGLFVVAVVSGLAMVRLSCGGVGGVAKDERGALGLAPREVVEVEA